MGVNHELKLYHYWRSSCSWRVRWALEYKEVPFQTEVINLLKAEQKSEDYKRKAPTGHVPCMSIDSKYQLTESLAIIDWLEEVYPEKSLYPSSAMEKAQVKELANIIASGTQPIQNLKVLKFYSEDAEMKKKWASHFIREGLRAYESKLKALGFSGKFSYKDQITVADLCLVPQVYNANRFEVDMTEFPLINKINENSLLEVSCKRAHPDTYAPNNS